MNNTEIKVLLVDDEERFLTTTQKLLRKKGFDVGQANSGTEAMRVLENQEFDVVVLDVKMPGVDGIQTLKEVKRLYPSIEVIMLTGHAMVDTAIEGLGIGAEDYVMKPTDMDSLVEKIQLAYQKRQLNQEKRSLY